MKVFLCVFAIQEEHTCVRQHSKVPSCHNIWNMRGVNDSFWAHGRVWWCDSTSCTNQRRSRQSPSLMEEWPFPKKCNGKRHRPGSLSLNSEWWLGPKTCNPEKHAVQSKSLNRKWSPSPLDCQMTPAATCFSSLTILVVSLQRVTWSGRSSQNAPSPSLRGIQFPLWNIPLATLTACIVQTSNPSRRCFLANCNMTSWEETRICSCHGNTFVRSHSSESHKTSNSCLSRWMMKMPWAPEAKLEEAFNIVSMDHARVPVTLPSSNAFRHIWEMRTAQRQPH